MIGAFPCETTGCSSKHRFLCVAARLTASTCLSVCGPVEGVQTNSSAHCQTMAGKAQIKSTHAWSRSNAMHVILPHSTGTFSSTFGSTSRSIFTWSIEKSMAPALELKSSLSKPMRGIQLAESVFVGLILVWEMQTI